MATDKDANDGSASLDDDVPHVSVLTHEDAEEEMKTETNDIETGNSEERLPVAMTAKPEEADDSVPDPADTQDNDTEIAKDAGSIPDAGENASKTMETDDDASHESRKPADSQNVEPPEDSKIAAISAVNEAGQPETVAANDEEGSGVENAKTAGEQEPLGDEKENLKCDEDDNEKKANEDEQGVEENKDQPEVEQGKVTVAAGEGAAGEAEGGGNAIEVTNERKSSESNDAGDALEEGGVNEGNLTADAAGDEGEEVTPVTDKQADEDKQGSKEDATEADTDRPTPSKTGSSQKGSKAKAVTPQREKDKGRKPDGEKGSGGGAGRAKAWQPVEGELVWAKVRSHPWWPARVLNPSEATGRARASRREGHLLIGFYGDQTL